MEPLAKYIVSSFILSASAAGLAGLAFFVAAEVFSSTHIRVGEVRSEFSPPLTTAGPEPSSPVAGTKTAAAANGSIVADSPPQATHYEWVEVAEDVNMRVGPTRSSSVLAVKIKGTRMKVASRDANWIEVVDSDTGRKGWIYQKFLRDVPATEEAELSGVNSRW